MMDSCTQAGTGCARKQTHRRARDRAHTVRTVLAAVAAALTQAVPAALAQPAKAAPTREAAEQSAASLPALGADATLADYQTFAALRNPGLRAAHDRWQAAMELVMPAASLPDPRFSYTYYIEQVETRVGPQRQRFGLSQMFPWFGKRRLRGEVAARAAEAVWFELQHRRLKLFYHLSVSYYDYYYLKQATDVTQENFNLLRDLEAVARERYRTGDALTAVMQAQLELGKLEDRLRSLHELRPALAARLNAAMSRDRHTPIPWPAQLPGPLPELDTDAVLAEVQARNPELGRLTTLAEKERIGMDLADKRTYPDISLGVSVVDTEDALMPGTPDSGKDPIMATLSLNLPIWQGKTRAQRRAAQLRRSAAVVHRQDRANSLEADATMALYHYRDAGRKLNLYRDTLIPKAHQAMEVAQQAFQTAKADFLALIEAHRALLEFQLAVAQAQAEQGKRYAELQMLTGAAMPSEQP